MAAVNSNNRVPFDGPNPVPPVNRLAERVRHYFDQHPDVGRQRFLLEAIRKEIDISEQREAKNDSRPARRQGEPTGRRFFVRPPLTAEDIRLHAWLSERLALLHHERHGLWAKVRRFIFRNRLMRWLRHGV